VLIDTSIIHDTLAVIANEVKQSSGLLFWIAAPASPTRNDGVFWIPAYPKDSLS
jgi:hypothetical protein